jgi:hypothetical protein
LKAARCRFIWSGGGLFEALMQINHGKSTWRQP